jgi:uncharacterized protein (TIGR02118 family)
MHVVLGFYRRKAGLTLEEFSDYWRDKHGPLLRAPEISRYLRRYVQHHVRPNDSGDKVQALPFDGFSEVWYDNKEDRIKLLAEPYFREMIVPDEAVFLDTTLTRTSAYDTQVVQIG